MKTISSPYDLGFEAARRGIEKWRNPFRFGSPEYVEWIAGYERFGRNITLVRFA